MALLNVGGEIRVLATADRFEEIGKMVLRLALKGADEIALGIKQARVGDDAFAAVKEPHGFDRRMKWHGLQSACFGDDGLVAEIENADL